MSPSSFAMLHLFSLLLCLNTSVKANHVSENWQIPLDLRPGSSNSSANYWLGATDHAQSKSIYDSSYVVHRNVKDFGAKGDELSDDTKAIQKAISSDAIDWPTLKATSTFGANVVVDGFPLSADGHTRWNTNHVELNFHKEAIGVEHNTLYAYNIVNAANIFLGLAQVETPYRDPSPTAPVGCLLNSQYYDPNFSSYNGRAQCAMSWGLRIVADHNIFSCGTGVWLFFNGWSGTCASNHGNCQESVISIEDIPQNVVLYNFNAKAVQNVLNINVQLVAPRVPWWRHI